MVEKLIGRFCSNARFGIKVKLYLLQFLAKKNSMFVCFAFFPDRIISIWAQLKSCYYQKPALVQMIEKTIAAWKKISNVTLSRMGKCYSRFPSSYFFSPMSKKGVENRSSYWRRTLASFFTNLRNLSEYG